MSAPPDPLFDGKPGPGETIEVAPGIWWAQFPLPFKLNHVNIWLLDDGPGWTVVDTGIDTEDCRQAWERIFEKHCREKPIHRVMVSHYHPDHVGLAGWLTVRWSCRLWMPRLEFAHGRMLSLASASLSAPAYESFYRAAGMGEERQTAIEGAAGRYRASVHTYPATFHRLEDGDEVDIGLRRWRVITAGGHAPDHACLYSEADNILISQDQVLPRISPNVSVWPHEPDGEPLSLFLDGLMKIRAAVPTDATVLPGHDWPFTGLHGRIETLIRHHDERMDATLEACVRPTSAIDVLAHLFPRPLDTHQVFFAIGETLAHLHFLNREGRVVRETSETGVHLYHAA